ncbi:transposase [hot springs metagenome]|uniref:Transposase n=1 Tax=hot springs metagenome TaxID=433727 RepID=A0A5J4KRH5_9ZZZZ
MKDSTRQRKKVIRGIEEAYGRQWVVEQMYRILARGKQGVDSLMMEMGRMVAEAIMYIDREETAGPEYKPFCPDIYKWASQPGSVYIADQKVRVERPRLRGRQGEIQLKSYERMKEPDGFSEELLAKVLRGISCQKYAETVIEAAQAFGVSPSTVSRHIIEATEKQLKEFKERSLSDFRAFAIYLDTIHRAGEAFIIALGIDTEGKKMPLGFWQGATENHELCEELLADMERRGLKLTKRTIWVTDGGKGIIKALRDKFGKKLLHQRCTIHKDKNIQKHLAKRYRKEAHRKFKTALEQKSYEDAKEMLLEMEKWLRGINESAADSLLEAIEEILTLHRLKVPGLLRKTLRSTNPIESMFSMVRDAEGNIKRYRNSRMKQRWLASVLYCEKRFKRVNGYASIPDVIRNIEALEETGETVKVAA